MVTSNNEYLQWMKKVNHLKVHFGVSILIPLQYFQMRMSVDPALAGMAEGVSTNWRNINVSVSPNMEDLTVSDVSETSCRSKQGI